MCNIKNHRLKRLKLKLFPYKFELKYLPGKYMYIADYLSRSFVKHSQPDDDSMTEIVHVVSDCIYFSKDRLDRLKNETLNDSVLSRIMHYYNSGWPVNSQNFDNEMVHFFKMRKDITVEYGLVFINDKLVVPKTCRKETLDLAHEGHLGFDKIKSQMNRYYWPDIRCHLLNKVQSCDICQKYQRSKIKDPLLNHEIPDLPFNKIGLDFCEYGGKKYLIAVDYYSKWIEPYEVPNQDSDRVIQCCKDLFCKFGIAHSVVADQMPFSSAKFKQFAKDWGFEVINTSPYHFQSHGMVEKAVGIFKNLLKKCKEDSSDLHISLLNYRNSTVAGSNYSPAQLLCSRQLRSKIVTFKKDLEPCVVEKSNVDNKSQEKYYNASALKNESVFHVGQEVLIQNMFTKKWEKGSIVKKLDIPRSYLVKMQKNNRILQRNTKFIRNLVKRFKFFEGVNNVPDSRVFPSKVNQLPNIEYETHDHMNNQFEAEPNSNNSVFHPQPNLNVTRRGRIIRPPNRLTM
ncbi:hypothetical protein WDU94_003669 [Cyamophila willieti]